LETLDIFVDSGGSYFSALAIRLFFQMTRANKANKKTITTAIKIYCKIKNKNVEL